MASDNKYDRQERLWGSHGQKALMEARICLLGSTAVGTETLKNLVLPGCGQVTIVDDAIVAEGDLGNNFFVTAEDVGTPRAEAVCKWLVEMNDDVKGEARVANAAELAETEPGFFTSFSLIIATQLPRAALRKVAAIAWAAGIPFMAVRSVGMLGSVRIALPHHAVYESKPDGQELKTDLRLAAPFPELLEVAEEFPFEGEGEEARKRRHDLPWPLLLLHAAKLWKAQHDGAAPSGIRGKKEFRALVKSLLPPTDEDEPEPENVAEAVEHAPAAFAGPETAAVKKVMESVPAVLEAAKASGGCKEPYWYFVQAIAEFMEGEGAGRPPLSGFLPDMTASTAMFIRLQSAYKARADTEAASVRARMDALLVEAGLKPEDVPQGQFSTWVKAVQFADVIHYRSIEDEYTTPNAKCLDETLYKLSTPPAPEHAPLKWYIMMRAADAFFEKHGRWPGDTDATLSQDAEELLTLGQAEAGVMGLPAEHVWTDAEYESSTVPLLTPAHAQEMARYGGCELHTVSGIVGGLASQEAVKLLTHQFVPVDNTFIFNGIASVAESVAV